MAARCGTLHNGTQDSDAFGSLGAPAALGGGEESRDFGCPRSLRDPSG